jgi:hypothetical protein
MRVRLDTRSRRSFRKAPRPREAIEQVVARGVVDHGLLHLAAVASAIDTAYTGKPCRKLVVPSSGSMIQT